jgi:hypothetical protein
VVLRLGLGAQAGDVFLCGGGGGEGGGVGWTAGGGRAIRTPLRAPIDVRAITGGSVLPALLRQHGDIDAA